MSQQDYRCEITLLCYGRDVKGVQEQLRHALHCLFDEPCILEMKVDVPVPVPAGSNLDELGSVIKIAPIGTRDSTA